MRTVAVLGTGTIGSSWASLFTARGLAVRAYDPAPDFPNRLARAQETGFESLNSLGLLVDKPGELTFAASPQEALEGADFVQESASENLASKRDLYQKLGEVLGERTIIASSTSFLMPGQLQEGLDFAGRICVGHPFNPPHLIPLVEVVGGPMTAPATLDAACGFYESLGKRVVRLKKEANGHLVNRLQAALWREAIHAVVDGIAELSDVDAAIAYGPGLRWALMGPHLTFHLAGGDGGMKHFVEHLGDANEEAWRHLGSPHLDSATNQALIEGCAQAAGGLDPAELRARRDKQLLALLKHTERVL